MNQKLNTWLCKHFDKETEHISDSGRKTIISKKGYVTIWDILVNVIFYPAFIIIIIAMVAFLVIAIPGIFLTNDQFDNYQIMVKGIMFWIAITFIGILIYIVKKIVNYKVAVCPLVNKTEGKTDLKKAEEEMFNNILKEE